MDRSNLNYENLSQVYKDNSDQINAKQKVILVNMNAKSGKIETRELLADKDGDIPILDKIDIWWSTTFGDERKIEDALPKVIKREYKHIKQELKKLDDKGKSSTDYDELEKDIDKVDKLKVRAEQHYDSFNDLWDLKTDKRAELTTFHDKLSTRFTTAISQAKTHASELKNYNAILEKWNEVGTKEGAEKIATLKDFLALYSEKGNLRMDLQESLDKKISREQIKEALSDGIESAEKNSVNALVGLRKRIESREKPPLRVEGVKIPLVEHIKKWREDSKTLLSNVSDCSDYLRRLKGKTEEYISDPELESRKVGDLRVDLTEQENRLEEAIQVGMRQVKETIEQDFSKLPETIVSGKMINQEKVRNNLYFLKDLIDVSSNPTLNQDIVGFGREHFNMLEKLNDQFASSRFEFVKGVRKATEEANLDDLSELLTKTGSEVKEGPLGEGIVKAMSDDLAKARQSVLDKKEHFQQLLADRGERKEEIDSYVSKLTDIVAGEEAVVAGYTKYLEPVTIPSIQKEPITATSIPVLLTHEGVLQKIKDHEDALGTELRKLRENGKKLEEDHKSLPTEESLMNEFAAGNPERLSKLQKSNEEYKKLMESMQKGRKGDANTITEDEWLKESVRWQGYEAAYGKMEQEWLEENKKEEGIQQQIVSGFKSLFKQEDEKGESKVISKGMEDVNKSMNELRTSIRKKIARREALRNDPEVGVVVKQLESVRTTAKEFPKFIEENNEKVSQVSEQRASCRSLQTALKSAQQSKLAKEELARMQEEERLLSNEAELRANIAKCEDLETKIKQFQAIPTT